MRLNADPMSPTMHATLPHPAPPFPLKRQPKHVGWGIQKRDTTTLLIALLFSLLPATTANARTCPPTPTPIRDLDLARYYSDTAGTQIDEAKKAAKRSAVAPLKNFMTELAKDADRVWQSQRPDSAAAACPLSWLADWATADALLGRMATKQADYERHWALAGLAMSYVKLRPFATSDQRREIDEWLIRLADNCRAFFDHRGRKRNNHWYWLGLGLAAVGLATDSDRYWTEARSIMLDAANDIQADGTLPLELKRGKRALHYHNFSAQPLFAMTLLAHAKEEDWAAFNGGAFQRLVRFISAAICASKPIFAIEALPRQDAMKTKDFESAWLQHYVALNPDRDDAACARPLGLKSRPSNDHRLGGDLSALRRALDATYE